MYKKLNNPDLPKNSMLKISASDSGCCVSGLTECQYVSAATDLTASGVKSVEIDSKIYAFAEVAETTDALVAATITALEGAGYWDFAEALQKSTVNSDGVKSGIVGSGADTAAVVTIYGEAVVTKYVNAADANIAFTKTC